MMLMWKRDNGIWKVKRRKTMEIEDAVLTLSGPTAAKIEWPLNRKLFGIFFWVVFIAMILLGLRVGYLNVWKGSEYAAIAERNSVRSIAISAPRGIIYDRFGTPLVSNVPSLDVVVVPADIPKDPAVQKDFRSRLADLFHLSGDTLDVMFAAMDFHSITPMLLKEHISQDEELVFFGRGRNFPGVSIQTTAERSYADSFIFSHVLGYEGKMHDAELTAHPEYLPTDSIGKQGLEKSYESVLRGRDGAERVEVDSLGQVTQRLGSLDPIPGSDLILNIDAELQKKLVDVLGTLLEKQGLKRAAAVAIDPRDGSVLSLVSLPSYDNNLFASGISTNDYQKLTADDSQPLFDRAISGEYPPGSTIKPVLATAALSDGIVNEHTQIESRGGISVGSFTFGDWAAHGFTDIRRAIAVSSDVFFYTVGGGYGGIRGLGMDRMKYWENLFGYGSKTGIDLPSEADGFIPDTQWKKDTFGERWYVGDDYHAAIGQGFVLTTPIQIVNGVAAIANGGTLYTPRLVSQVRAPDGTVTKNDPKVIRDRFVDPSILRVVREGMRETVTDGTAQSLKDIPVEVAGKTGTAQFGNDQKTHGWFVSFAPFDAPRIAMIVLVEGQGGEGYNAVPVTREVYQWYFSRTDRNGSQ